jgi:hypothetical protein
MSNEKSTKNPEDATVKATPKRKSAKRLPGPKPYCGIIMPISAIDGCAEPHWADVREIIEAAISGAGFEARLVSDADEVGIIQKRIIQNVYDDPIVVCDVSGKNPNVMFELGMRLAFDKPTIIIKDDKTAYTFDTAPIEHLEYPRDLRFAKIVEFQQNLSGKIEATHNKAQSDKNYTTFLKNFGSFSVAKIETRTMDKDEFILEELRGLKSLMLRMPPRIIEEHEPVMNARDAQERAIAQRTFIHRAVRQAIHNMGSYKTRKDMTQAVRDYILQHENPGRHFQRPSEFEKALELELRSLGYVK